MNEWTNERRREYLRSVVNRLNAIKLLHDAALKGTLADPYAVNDEVVRAVKELEAVMGSLEN
jgi:hypothetical protein